MFIQDNYESLIAVSVVSAWMGGMTQLLFGSIAITVVVASATAVITSNLMFPK